MTTNNGSSSDLATRAPDWQPAAAASVQSDVPINQGRMGANMASVEYAGAFILQMASIADNITPWGTSTLARDRQLRRIWTQEPLLAATVYTAAARNAALNFGLAGPKELTTEVLDMLHRSEMGAGWLPLMLKTSIDYYTQDNGGWIEIIRDGDQPSSPVMGLAHLDSARCIRTGNWRVPVVYLDMYNKYHELQWYEVIEITEFPSPIEEMRGLQYCALTRVLRSAQFARDFSLYKNEKVGGRFVKAIHLVTGFSQKVIEDRLKIADYEADDRGLVRFQGPVILANPDPSATVDVKTLEIATLPDNFDEQTWFSQYVATLAATFGLDYQDIAPLPAGNLGSSSQSQILHLKSRGKGPALFMKSLEHKFNFHGVVPRSVRYAYNEHDTAQEKEEAELAGMRMRAIEAFVRAFTPAQVATPQPEEESGRPNAESSSSKEFPRANGGGVTVSPEAILPGGLTRAQWVAAEILNDWGMLRPEYLKVLGITEVDPSRVVTDEGEALAADPALNDNPDKALPTVPKVVQPPASQPPSTLHRTVTKSVVRDAEGRVQQVIEEEAVSP